MANEIAQRPEVREMLESVSSVVARAKSLTVATPDEFEAAGNYLKLVKEAQKRVEDMRTKITKPMNDALKEVNNLFRTPGDHLAQAEKIIKASLGTYQQEQDRLARIEQDRLNAEAQREQDRLNELARKAAEAGRADAAERHAERAAQVVAPIVQREAPKVSGVSMRDVWKFQIEKPELIPRAFLSVDESKIGRYVSAMKADANIAGVRIYCEKQVAAGSR